jgi:tetratricopeptide (TPR) repeat protein
MKVFGIVLCALFLTTLTFAQCDQLDNHPKGKEHALRLFVYRDFIKNKQYNEALPNWEELYTHCKAGNGNILQDGIEMYEYFVQQTQDDAKKKEYNEKIATMMQERINCYGNTTVRKSTGLKFAGYRYYELGKHYYKVLNDPMRALEAFDKSIAADGNKVEKNLLTYYAFITVQHFKEEKISKEKALEVHNQLMDLMNTDLATFGETKTAIADEFDKIARDIFDCGYFVIKVEPTFYQNYDNAEFIKENVIVTLKKRQCEEDEPLVAKAMARYKAIQDSIIVSNRDDIDNGNIALRDENYSEAKRFFATGIENTSIDSDKRFKAAMRLGKLHEKDGSWSSAMDAYRKAASLNPNSGEPYISIGMLYLSANKSCDAFERQIIAGGALDQFRKARNYSDTASEASEKISTYGAYLPTKEVLFQRGMTPGSGTTVGCVIKVSTTIQTK